jgi:3-deoxy-manno-octulosonate cytidylyltransferase (CMP-KDO synthetase)
MSTAIVIPARMKSSRFPGKALIDMNGKPLIRRVFDICQTFGYDTYVLTDSKEIADVITKFNVIMTSPDCTDGTDRCLSVIGDELHYDKYINVQGDTADPNIEVVKAIEKALDDHYVIQAHKKMTPEGQLDPTVCKMVQTNNIVHWFVRSELKYGDFALGYHGYTPEAKERWNTFTHYDEEKIEAIEAMRWIQNNDTLKTICCEDDGIEINNENDYWKWIKKNIKKVK